MLGSCEQLVYDYGPLIWTLCRRLSDSPEDDYQAIWEKVFRALPTFVPDSKRSVEGWFVTVARRHLIDQHRRQKVRGISLQLGDIVSTHSMENQVDAIRLTKLIEHLPLEQRRAVVLHYLENTPLEELAEEEGVPVGTIKSRLHRGRARLLAWLRGER